MSSVLNRVVALALAVLQYGIAPATQAADSLSDVFERLDEDGDSRLSLPEYRAYRNENPDVAKRDFFLFDFDGDGHLSFEEFRTIPTVAEPSQRGPLPDPLDMVLDRAIEATDQSYAGWEKNPELEIELNSFVSAFASTFGLSWQDWNMSEADPNGDRKVSRAEAKRFLEIQLGIRDPHGRSLRESNGRVYNYVLFDHIDANQNDRLEKDEFLERFPGNDAAAVFAAADRDGDGILAFDEWRTIERSGVIDTVNEFRRLDANLDGFVDPQELAEGTADWMKQMAANVFPAFDLDGDGRLNLYEFRLTMQANPLLKWQRVLKDKDGDGVLEFAEFDFGSPRFSLLRYFYFSKLDRNNDGSLDPSEFTFEQRAVAEFFTLSADGKQWTKLLRFNEYPEVGSPKISPDGKQFAFDAYRLNPRTPSASFIANIDGAQPQKIAEGMMPTWSNDGKSIALSHRGVQIVDLNGRNRLQIDPSGWGAQWSPDGAKIAYTVGTSIKTYDVETKEIETVLDGGSHDYRRIYWNMEWSPDSNRLCFKGQKADGSLDMAIVPVGGENPSVNVRYSARSGLVAQFAWHPDGKRVVFFAFCPERNKTQMYECDPDTDNPPTLVEGQDPTRNNKGGCWSPDGEYMIVVSGGE